LTVKDGGVDKNILDQICKTKLVNRHAQFINNNFKDYLNGKNSIKGLEKELSKVIKTFKNMKGTDIKLIVCAFSEMCVKGSRADCKIGDVMCCALTMIKIILGRLLEKTKNICNYIVELKKMIDNNNYDNFFMLGTPNKIIPLPNIENNQNLIVENGNKKNYKKNFQKFFILSSKSNRTKTGKFDL
jgi:hypothetical protein